jgi:uncharacterized protein (UPF0216 family)
MKHVKLYEDFDLDKFLEDPQSQFHDDSNPDIEEGDWVNSYRGPGQLLMVNQRDTCKVQLLDGPGTIAHVPREALTKITKEEAMKISRNLPDTQKELKEALEDIMRLEETSISYNNGEMYFSGKQENVISYFEDLLVDLIDLKNKDSYTPYYTEFHKILTRVALICDLIIDSVDDNALKNRISVMQDKFFEVSE